MKLITYFSLSFFGLLAIVYYAVYTQRQFYPIVSFLVSSKLALVIVGNFALALTLGIGNILSKLYFGTLREIEMELLIERAKYSIIETCLAFTIFRGELTIGTFTVFALLIFVKLAHKVTKARLEYLDQIAPVPLSKQIRMGFLLATLILIDIVGLYYTVTSIMQKGKSVLILFGFEFGLLLNYAINLKTKFIVQLIDNYSPNGFQSRGFVDLLVDLCCEVIKVVTYLIFFSLVFMNYGLPFYLIRDVYSACLSFQRKLSGFIKYVRLTRNFESRFPDATPEELTNAGHCLVCREEIHQGKKLPCNHVFHLECLRSWLQHQQSCPLCRSEIPNEAATVPEPIVQPNINADQNIPAVPNNIQDNNIQVPANPAPVVNPVNVVNQQEGAIQNINNMPLPPGFQQRQENLSSVLDDSISLTLGSREITSEFKTPNFFITHSDIQVVNVPSASSVGLRMIPKGTIVYATHTVLSSEGKHYLKLGDGWIPRETLATPGNPPTVGVLPLTQLTPQNNIFSSTSKKDLRDNHEIELEMNCRENLDMEFSNDTYSRMQKINELQKHVRKLTIEISRNTNSLLECQEALNELLQDEIQISDRILKNFRNKNNKGINSEKLEEEILSIESDCSDD